MALKSKEKVDKYIYQKILALEDGGRMPGVRKIMRDCGVSQLTVQTILKKYENLNLIEASDRRGFFKVGDINDHFSYDELDLVFCSHAKQSDPMMSFQGNLLNSIGKSCGKYWQSIRMHFMENSENLTDFKHIAQSSKCRACILISPHSPKVSEIFRQNHVAYVNLFPNSLELDKHAPNLINDNEKLVNSQLHHLIELGHKKIGYMHLHHPEKVVRGLYQRLEMFKKLADKNGVIAKPEWIQFGGYDSDITTKAMEKILSGSDQPTAVICNDHHLPGIYSVLHNHNMTPGKDFSIVGANDLGISRILTPQGTTISLDIELAAEKALKMLEKTINDLDYNETLILDSKLIIRGSTGKNLNIDK